MGLSRSTIFVLCLSVLGGCAEPGADLVFLGGAVYTVDDRQPWAEAVAVSGGRIIYVGDDDGAGAHIGTATNVIELGGHMLLPGFHDSHMHPMRAGTAVVAGSDWISESMDPLDTILIVLDRNLFELKPMEISRWRVLLTLLQGEVVWMDPEFPAVQR